MKLTRVLLSLVVLALLAGLGVSLSWKRGTPPLASPDSSPAVVAEPVPPETALASAPVPAGGGGAEERPSPVTVRPHEELGEEPFRHEFLSLHTVEERQLRALEDGRWERTLLGRVREYPDRVYLREVFVVDGATGFRRESVEIDVAEEFILKLGEAGPEAREAVRARHRGELVRGIEEIPLWTLRFPVASLAAREALEARLREDPQVEELMPNSLIWPTRQPNDPGYPNQWELRQIDPEPGWELLTDAAINDRSKVVIAVIDTGVNIETPEISPWVNVDEVAGNGLDDDGNGRIDDLHGFDFITNTGDVHRTSGHGVSVAYHAGSVSNNGGGRASAAWAVDIMAGVVFSTSGAGSTSAAANAIHYAAREGAHVINCSFVGGAGSTYAYVFSVAASENAIVVAGAGNNGRNLDGSPLFPVCSHLDNVVGVGATDKSDARSSFSNYSATHVEVFAPSLSGTSFSAPLASSVVALLRADDPEAPYAEIIDRLLNGVDRNPALDGLAVSGGRINLTSSLRLNTLRRPADLRAWHAPEGGVLLTWRDQATAETGFVVERTTTDPASVRNPDEDTQLLWKVVSTSVPANQTWYRDAGATGPGPYFYRVRAKGTARNSARNFVTRVTPSLETAPMVAPLAAHVSDLYIRSGEASVELAWFSPVAAPAGYVLERSEDGGANFYEISRLGPDETRFHDARVVAGAGYHYRLKTFNLAEGRYSATVGATVGEGALEPLLNAPTGFEILVAEPWSLELSWTSLTGGQLGYRLHRAFEAGGPFTLLVEFNGETRAFVDTTVTPETTYWYRLDAFDAFGTESTEILAAVTPAPPPVLGTPSLSAAAIGANAVSLGWVDLGSERHAGYVLERAGEGGDDFSIMATLGAAERSWLDETVSPESVYRYRVGATDGSEVRYSHEEEVGTPPLPPVLRAPVVSAMVGEERTVTLSWEDQSERETGYRVERAEGADVAYTTVANLPAEAARWVDAGLEAGRAYTYRVTVYAEGSAPGEALSEPISVRTFTVEEAWRLEFFGTTDEAGDAAMGADPDGDGWTNLAEFATLQSPIVAQPMLATPGMTADSRLTLSFQRRWDAGVTFRIEAVERLGGAWETLLVLPAGSNIWQSVDERAVVEETGTGPSRAVRVVDAVPTLHHPRYLRLVIDEAL
jgi:hypothetical protein